MTETAGEAIILKILTGVQSGVDVFLVDGVYSLGSGEDDDIQVLDVSLQPGHLRLKVADGKVAIAGGAGMARTATGSQIEANGEFGDLEPLDVVWIGTTRFTTGLASANWSSLAEEPPPVPVKVRRRGLRAIAVGPVGGGPGRWQVAVPLALVLTGLGFGASLLPYAAAEPEPAGVGERGSADHLRAAIARLPFAGHVEVRSEVDGAVFVSGFVETPAERRAVQAEARGVDPEARLRIGVLDAMRAEVAQLLASEAPSLSSTLSDAGRATLAGTILDPAEASRVAALVESSVAGLTGIDSRIRTRDTLLADVRQLSERSQIAPLTVLRLDGSLIEISGIVPSEKIDAWVGFLQAYSSQYAREIALRSLVRLQNPDGTLEDAPSSGAVVVGDAALGEGDVRLDPERLVAGTYDLADIFADQNEARPAAAENGADQIRPPPLDVGRLVHEVALSGNRPALEPGTALGSGTRAAPRVVGSPTPLVPLPGSERRGDAVGDLISSWNAQKLPSTAEGRRLRAALDALAAEARPETGADAANLSERYAPIRRRDTEAAPAGPCWNGSLLNGRNLPSTMFWLDLLSVSDDLTLGGLEASVRPMVLEAALNPAKIQQCMQASGMAIRSIYLDEIARNPGFVNFVTRDLSAYSLDIAGASLGGDRFVQLRGGQKLREGAAPDRNSRIAGVGELGVAVDRGNDDLSAVIFGTNVNWILR